VIRASTQADWPAIVAIYQSGIDTGHARFEDSAGDWAWWDATFRTSPRLVASDHEGRIQGWLAVAQVSPRPSLSGLVEVSVYVDPASRGKGAGSSLLDALKLEAAEEGIWSVQAGIFPENQASLRLHAKAGFRKIGIRERMGLMTYGPMAGIWRDVVLMEWRAP